MAASPYIHCADGYPKVLEWVVQKIDTRHPDPFPGIPTHYVLNWEKVGEGSALERLFLQHYFSNLTKPTRDNLPAASNGGVQVNMLSSEITIARSAVPPKFVWESRGLFDLSDENVWSGEFDEACRRFNAGTTKQVEFVADWFEDYDGQWLDVARAYGRSAPERVILGSAWSVNRCGHPVPVVEALTLKATTSIGHFCDVVSDIVHSQWAQVDSKLQVQRRVENNMEAQTVQFVAPSKEMLCSVLPLFRQVLETNRLDDLISEACSSYVAIAKGHSKATWVGYEKSQMQQCIQSSSGIMAFPRKPQEAEAPSLKEMFEAVGYGLRIFHANPKFGTERLKRLVEVYPLEYVINALDSGLRDLLAKLAETRNVMAPDLRHWIDHHGAPKPDTVELFPR